MDNRMFKKRISEIFKKMSYEKNKKFYYKEYAEVYLKYNLQKSNFSNGWYINFDIAFKEIHCKEEILNSWERDISERIVINKDGVVDLFDLDHLDSKKWIFEEIERKVIESNKIFRAKGIRQYLKENPDCLMWTSFETKVYLQENGCIESL